MKVKELILELQTVDPELLVILQKDAEGNGYSPLRGVDLVHYEAENTYSGQAYGLDDPDAPAEICEHAIVLHPIN